MNNKKKLAMPSVFFSLIVASIVTLMFWLRLIRLSTGMENLKGWALYAIFGAIFLFSFSLPFCIFYLKKFKTKIKINKYIIFLIISIIFSVISIWLTFDNYNGFWDIMLNFSLVTGMCFIIFTILYKFDYDNIKSNLFQLAKSLFYYVIFPSMFLIIALMGKIDKTGTFMVSVNSSLSRSGQIISDNGITLTQIIYDIGKYEYSGLFMLLTFIFCIFLATRDFFKKSKLKNE